MNDAKLAIAPVKQAQQLDIRDVFEQASMKYAHAVLIDALASNTCGDAKALGCKRSPGFEKTLRDKNVYASHPYLLLEIQASSSFL